MDALARKLEIDPVELRRKNFIREFPTTIAVRPHGRLRRLRRVARPARSSCVDYDALRAEQAERRERGDTKLLGVGFSTYIEMCGLAPSRILGAIRYVAGGWDAATIRFLPTGTVQALDRHVAARAGPRDDVLADRRRPARRASSTTSRCCTATRRCRRSAWTPTAAAASRSAASRSGRPREKIIAKAKTIAAHQLEVAEDDLELRRRHVHGRRHRPLDDGRRGSRSRPGRRTTCPTGWSRGSRRPPSTTRRTSAGRAARTSPWSRSTPRPAPSTSCRYVAVDDVGVVINPTIVDGQVHGGIAQGIAAGAVRGGGLRRGGQPAHGTMADLHGPVGRGAAVVRARPHRDAEPDNPMGVKGVGETGTIAVARRP